jgi:hypothetical protein
MVVGGQYVQADVFLWIWIFSVLDVYCAEVNFYEPDFSVCSVFASVTCLGGGEWLAGEVHWVRNVFFYLHDVCWKYLSLRLIFNNIRAETHVIFHVKWLLNMSDQNGNWKYCAILCKILQYQVLWEFFQGLYSYFMCLDRRTDWENVIGPPQGFEHA